MFNQSGISKLTLYGANSTTFDRVSTTSVTNIQGDNIEFDNTSNPKLTQNIAVINRRNYFAYSFDFVVFGISWDTSQLKNTFGWLVLIDFLDGETRFLNTPVFFEETALDTNNTNFRAIRLKTNRPTDETLNVV